MTVTHTPTIAELAALRLALAARDWLKHHTCQPEETTEALKDESDFNLEAVLLCEGEQTPDDAIESIEGHDYGVLILLESGQELYVDSVTGRVNRC